MPPPPAAMPEESSSSPFAAHGTTSGGTKRTRPSSFTASLESLWHRPAAPTRPPHSEIEALFPQKSYVHLPVPRTVLEKSLEDANRKNFDLPTCVKDPHIVTQFTNVRFVMERPGIKRNARIEQAFHDRASGICKGLIGPMYVAYTSEKAERFGYIVGALSSTVYTAAAPRDAKIKVKLGRDIAEQVGETGFPDKKNPLGQVHILGVIALRTATEPPALDPARITATLLEHARSEVLFPPPSEGPVRLGHVMMVCSYPGFGRALLDSTEAVLRDEGYDGVRLESLEDAYAFYALKAAGYRLHDRASGNTFPFIKAAKGDGVVPYALFVGDAPQSGYAMVKSFHATSTSALRPPPTVTWSATERMRALRSPTQRKVQR